MRPACWLLISGLALITPSLLGSDCNSNGVPDQADISGRSSRDCNLNAIPDECEVEFGDCNSNGVPDGCDISSGAAVDCNRNGLPDACEVQRSFAFDGQAILGARETIWSKAADIDGDSWPDLMSAGTAEIVIYFGQGGGTLGSAVMVASQGGPLAAADLDADGDLDLVAGASEGVTGGLEKAGVSVYRKIERREFGPGKFQSLPVAALALSAGDLDGDGRIDVLASAAGATWLFRGQGDGTVSEAVVVASDGGDLTTGDFDGDGDLDLAVGDPAISVGHVQLNDGQGDLIPGDPILAGGGGLVAGDLDADGDLDLASGGGAVDWNLGQGSFQNAWVLLRGGPFLPGNQVAAGDLDGDGDADLYWTRNAGISVLLNDGQRGFAPEININTLSNSCIESADFNRDGLADLAVGNSLLLNLGGPRDFGRRVYASPPDFTGLQETASADLDGDGDLDLAVVSEVGNLRILSNRGDGSFVPALELSPTVSAVSPVAGDFDGDGDADLAIGDPSAGEIIILWNEGALSFGKVRLTVPAPPDALTAADLDGALGADLVITSRTARRMIILRNEGGGSFALPVSQTLEHEPVFVTPFDMDGDRDLDLAAGWTQDAAPPGGLSLYLNDGQGAFSPGPVVDLAGAPHISSAGDFNGDGRDDLAIGISVAQNCIPGFGCRHEGQTSILLSDGQGAFHWQPIGDPRFVPASLAPADLDGDGALDLAVLYGSILDHDVSFLRNDVQVLLNHGSGGFLSAARSAVGTSPGSLLAGDLNGDGALDLIATSSASVSVLLNSTSSLARDVDHNGVPDQCQLAKFQRGDANRDGLMDISDAISILSHLFIAPPEALCDKAEDSNDDGAVDISDVISILGYMFLNGPPIPPPSGSCGVDLTADDLPCEPLPPCN